MDIQRSGSQPSAKGSEDYFTGTVRIDAPFKGTDDARASGATVTFEPGARTAWHTHPLGQTLVVLSRLGRVQREGGPIQAIRPGDIVWFPPGEKHWHGAAPGCAMSHIAIAEALDGKVVDWMEKVSDDQYGADRTAADFREQMRGRYIFERHQPSIPDVCYTRIIACISSNFRSLHEALRRLPHGLVDRREASP